ncbi:M81 family peptidase [Burkholderia stabilis]|uniref:Microcystinase C n=1 Tax=Burkholderia stabilis TaxID=95485 RepID=A0A4Q2A757_9BURK|nr:M81 family metallopeptidase [Burkholderia stabilis]RXV65029.1 M81 family peptidase [Burkholderia stabilis]
MATHQQRPRVAVAGLFHETNTYATECTGPTPLAAFRQYHGDEIERVSRNSNDAVGGFIEGASECGASLVYTYLAVATPSSTIEAGAYAQMKQNILDGIRAALPIDGVLLALHGAGVVEGVDDLEGDLLGAVRALVGVEVPIAAVYDLHGNMTDEMRESCDLTLPCRLYPHTDLRARGAEAAELLLRMVRGDLRPVTRMRRLPMLPYLIGTQSGSVAAKVNAYCAELAKRDGVIDCSWFHGFPYADIAWPCPVVVCMTDGDDVLAQRCADDAATWIWNHRDAFVPSIVSPAEGIARALGEEGGPVVVNERSDNPGGGTPGDATHLLRALLEANPPPNTCCFASINDKGVVEQAVRAGVGATIPVSLGGKLGRFQGTPIEAYAYVKAITDGRFVNRPGSMLEGMHFDLGKMCRLEISGVDVIVASSAQQVFDPEPFLLHGIDVATRKVVVLKGANHFRAGFGQLAADIISVDAEGLSTTEITSFPRQHLAQPLWPLTNDPRFETETVRA